MSGDNLKQQVLYTLNRAVKNTEHEWIEMVYQKYIKQVEKYSPVDYELINYTLKPNYFRDLYKYCPDQDWLKEVEEKMKAIHCPSESVQQKHRAIIFASEVIKKYNVLDFWFVTKEKYIIKGEDNE